MMKHVLVAISLFVFTLSVFSQQTKENRENLLNYSDINGMKQGHWIKKDLDGSIIYEGYFVDNLPVGTFKRFHANGQMKTELIFDENKQRYASVKMWDNTGELAATGFYDKRKKDSVWEYYGIEEKLVYHEEYKSGLRHGMCKKFYPSGQIAEEKEWKDGKMDGKWVQYYPDGKIRLMSQNKANARIGKFVVYQANGKPLVEGAYKNDRKDGKWIVYNPKGDVDKEMNFKEGKLENDQELARELTKELDEAEKLKGQFPEPSSFQNPEEFFLNRNNSGRY